MVFSHFYSPFWSKIARNSVLFPKFHTEKVLFSKSHPKFSQDGTFLKRIRSILQNAVFSIFICLWTKNRPKNGTIAPKLKKKALFSKSHRIFTLSRNFLCQLGAFLRKRFFWCFSHDLFAVTADFWRENFRKTKTFSDHNFRHVQSFNLSHCLPPNSQWYVYGSVFILVAPFSGGVGG